MFYFSKSKVKNQVYIVAPTNRKNYLQVSDLTVSLVPIMEGQY